jgi:eukaryotic-like serine/threonine-protein kinase
MMDAPLPRRYRVVGHLQRGKALDVYEVYSVERGCTCVAKIARPDRRDDARVRERLLREGALLERLAHPNLVRAYETVPWPDAVVVLELLTGETVEHLAGARRRRLAAADLVHLGLHLCSAVGYLHRNDVLHLDLKPANVVCEGGRAKLIDLSLARPPGPINRGLGTRAYLPPEQARGDAVGPPADVWGIGATLFEAAARRPPFPPAGDNGYAQLHARARLPARARRGRRALAGLIEACLEPAPEDRPKLGELERELAALAA